VAGLKLYQPLDLSLQVAIRDIKKGQIQLPEFQRAFRWPRKARRELLDSIQKGFPVGSLLLLEVGGKRSPFGIRPFENVKTSARPRYLVLDGQQRLATCYTTFVAESQDVITVNVPALLEATKGRSGVDVDFSRILVTKKRPRILDELLYSKDLLPMPLVTDPNALRKLLATYRDRLQKRKETLRLAKFVDVSLFGYLDSFLQYEFPCVVLPKNLDLEAVCNVFTKINTTGLTLSAFDLCVATLYPDKINLREMLRQAQKDDKLLVADSDGTNVLQTVALLSGKLPKKAALPKNITAKDIRSKWGLAVSGLVEASDLLTRNGIWDYSSVPYDALVPALGAALVETRAKHPGALGKELLHSRVRRWLYQTATVSYTHLTLPTICSV